MLPKTITGFELVGGTLRVAIVRSFLNRRRLVDSFEIPGFGSLSPTQQRQQLTELKKKHHISGSRFHLVLPHDDGIVRQIELPVEVRDKLNDVLTLQIEALSPWPVDDVYWAYAKATPARGSKTVSVTIIVIPRNVLDGHVALFQSAGFPLSGATLAVTAWAEGAAALWGSSSPVVVLGCEDGYVEGMLMAGNRFFVAAETGSDTASLAGVVLGRVLAEGRISDPETARLLAHGDAVERLAEEPSSRLPLENAPPGAVRKFGAIAAAIAGLGKSRFAANILPVEMRYRQSYVPMIPTYVLILMIAVTIVAAGLREPYQSRLHASQISQEIEQIEGEVTQVADREAALLVAEQRFQALAGHIREQDRNLEALYALATSLPETGWLSSYGYDDGRVTISGFAADTAQLQGLLEASPLFEEVEFSGSMTPDASGASGYTLEMALETTP